MAGYHILLCCCFIITYIVLTHSCSLIYKSSPTTWENAASECKKDGGRLVEVTNKHKWESMKKCFNTEQTWIGGYWSETDAGWTWTENNLPVKDPEIINSDKQGSFSCAYVDADIREQTYHINKLTIGNNVNCTTALPYICKCTGREKCLKFLSEKKATWTEAKYSCEEGNEHLGSFQEFEQKSEADKFEQIKKYNGWENMKSDYYWIGLQQKGWTWVSGNSVTFFNNLPLKISQTGNECFLATNTTWMLADCNTKHPFMCEKITTVESWLVIAVIFLVLLICAVAVILLYRFVFRKKIGKIKPKESLKIEKQSPDLVPTQPDSDVMYARPDLSKKMNRNSFTTMIDNDIYEFTL